MNKLHKRRLWLILFFALGSAIVAALILYALKQNINVFVTPTELSLAEQSPARIFRLGGMVKKASTQRGEGLLVKFLVTDFKNDISVQYTGVLPDLFREGKGVIVEGRMQNNVLYATQVLAKHDENYMPKQVYEKLKQQGKME